MFENLIVNIINIYIIDFCTNYFYLFIIQIQAVSKDYVMSPIVVLMFKTLFIYLSYSKKSVF